MKRNKGLAIAPLFGLIKSAEAQVLAELKVTVSDWKSLAHILEMTAADIERYAPVCDGGAH